jgi:hypothetical protein
MKNSIKILLILTIVLVFVNFVNAQPGSGGFTDEPNDVPLDGGVIILAVASASYGIKKLIKGKK